MSKSVDLRLPAVLYRLEGHTYAETAKIFHAFHYSAVFAVWLPFFARCFLRACLVSCQMSGDVV